MQGSPQPQAVVKYLGTQVTCNWHNTVAFNNSFHNQVTRPVFNIIKWGDTTSPAHFHETFPWPGCDLNTQLSDLRSDTLLLCHRTNCSYNILITAFDHSIKFDFMLLKNNTLFITGINKYMWNAFRTQNKSIIIL